MLVPSATTQTVLFLLYIQLFNDDVHIVANPDFGMYCCNGKNFNATCQLIRRYECTNVKVFVTPCDQVHYP
jgi:hypothetical protein